MSLSASVETWNRLKYILLGKSNTGLLDSASVEQFKTRLFATESRSMNHRLPQEQITTLRKGRPNPSLEKCLILTDFKRFQGPSIPSIALNSRRYANWPATSLIEHFRGIQKKCKPGYQCYREHRFTTRYAECDSIWCAQDSQLFNI